MKQRIYRSLCLMSLAALFLSMAASLLLYFSFYNSRTTESLMAQAEAVGCGIEALRAEYRTDLNAIDAQAESAAQEAALSKDVLSIAGADAIKAYLDAYKARLSETEGMRVRITLIGAKDGDVKFDTDEDQARMETHLNRPEFQEAVAQGSGSDERRSSTFGISTRYAAVLTEGRDLVVRVSAESSNLAGMFVSLIPLEVLAAVILFFLSMQLADYETRRIVAPLDAIAERIRRMGAPDIDAKEQAVYEELRPFLDSVSQSQRIRAEFSANVSHELKTPLTSISGFAELMKSGMVTDRAHVEEFSETIYKESQRLLRLIDDIMRLSRIEEGGEAPMERLDLQALAKETLNRLSEKAARHQVKLSLSGTEACITGNRTMMEELLFNLAENAIKYNHAGGHVYLVTGRRESEGKAYSFLTVADDGIGIPQADLGRVWERFYRVDKSHSRAIGGTGLGLSIVKHIAERHHARLDIRSEEGAGTRVTAMFPETWD